MAGVAAGSVLLALYLASSVSSTQQNWIRSKYISAHGSGRGVAFELPAKTVRYFPQSKLCPLAWMQQYAKRHSDIISGKQPPRHFVSVSVEAGLADRLTGLVTQLWHAVLTGRALTTYTYGSLPSFQAVCDAPFVNWTFPAAPLSEDLLAPSKYTYKGVRGFTGVRAMPSHVDANMYQMLYHINMDTKLGIYHTGNLTSIQSPDPTYLIGASNRGWLYALANNPNHKHQLWQMGLTPANSFMCGFFFLCAPAAAVEQYYRVYWEALQDLDTLKIGIQIRVGDQVFNHGEQPKLDSEVLQQGADWFQCAEALEKAFQTPGQRVLWFLNSDSQQLRKAAKAKYGQKLVVDDMLEMIHPDCFQNTKDGTHACQQAQMDLAFQHSLGAMLTFSLADYHVISSNSGFGRMGAWLSGKWNNIYEIEAGQRCAADRPTTPQESASRGAGV